MTTFVEIFQTGIGRTQERTDQINKFLLQKNAKPISVTSQVLCDRTLDGRICNEWTETVLIYELISTGVEIDRPRPTIIK